jgi:hypothetical protein
MFSSTEEKIVIEIYIPLVDAEYRLELRRGAYLVLDGKRENWEQSH